MYAAWFLNSTSRAPHLRIGVLLDGPSPTLPAYLAEVLEHIVSSNFARLELAVFNADAARLRNRTIRQRGLFARYVAWDAKRIPESPDPLSEVDCARYFQDVESFSVTPIADKGFHRFPEDAVARIREENLDVLVSFGSQLPGGEILNAARYGVWSYRHGDSEHYRGGPPYFWEVYEDNLISCAALQRLTDEPDAGKILYKGSFATCLGSSWVRNRVQPYWGSTTFLIQKLHQLHESGWSSLDAEIAPQAPYRGRRKAYTVPTNGQMLPWLTRLLLRTGFQRARRLIRGEELPHWTLGIRTEKNSSGNCGPSDLSGFRWIQSPRGHFYADPFVVEHLGKPWVFFEDLDYSTQKGIIACAEVIENSAFSRTMPVLEKPYHLSYPCIFYDNGRMYMVPESVADGTVQLYRCERFPDVWELVKVLLKAPVVDTTVWIEDGWYWFFVTLQEPRGDGLQLWLFHSRSLTGELIRHPRNPIVTDVRFSRGAGAIYREGGRLIRPSQDCSGIYGRRIMLNEVLVLNEREYAERPGTVIDTQGVAKIFGTHTYGRLKDVEVVDGCAWLPAKQVR
jgi:hypothetical protein